MKDKTLYFIIGLLVGAIITTGIFMIINKNNQISNGNRTLNSGNSPMMNGEPPTQEEISAGVRTEMEDGSVRIDLPNGGVIMQKGGPGPGGAGI